MASKGSKQEGTVEGEEFQFIGVEGDETTLGRGIDGQSYCQVGEREQQ